MIATRTRLVEAEDLPEVAPQLLDVVADAADAELAEIREVLADLRRIQVELLGQRLRRDRAHARRIEGVEAAQVDRQPVGRQLGDRLRRAARRGSAGRLFAFFTSLDLNSTAPRLSALAAARHGRRRTAQGSSENAERRSEPGSHVLAMIRARMAHTPPQSPRPIAPRAPSSPTFPPASRWRSSRQGDRARRAVRPDLRRLDGLPRACAPD